MAALSFGWLGKLSRTLLACLQNLRQIILSIHKQAHNSYKGSQKVQQCSHVSCLLFKSQLLRSNVCWKVSNNWRETTLLYSQFFHVFLCLWACVCALYYGPNVFSWRKVSFHRKCWLAELSSLPKRERVRAKTKKRRENCTLHGGPIRDKLFARLDSASALKPEEIRKRKCWGKTPTLLRKSWTFSKNQH